MNKINDDTYLKVLRKIHTDSKTTQRGLAYELDFSLGKLNFLINELRKKGLVKLKNFKSHKNKVKSLRYILTPKGLTLRTKLLAMFMKKKLKEYDELKTELEIK